MDIIETADWLIAVNNIDWLVSSADPNYSGFSSDTFIIIILTRKKTDKTSNALVNGILIKVGGHTAVN